MRRYSSIIERLLELWDEQTGGSVGDDIIVKLGTTEPFDKKGMRLISKRKDIQMLRDTATTAYQFFRNGWVSITSDGTSPLKQYSELPTDKFVWNSSVVRRDWVTHSSMMTLLTLLSMAANTLKQVNTWIASVRGQVPTKNTSKSMM